MTRIGTAFKSLLFIALTWAPLAQAATATLDFTATLTSTNPAVGEFQLSAHYLLDTLTPNIGAGGLAEYRFAVIEGTIVVGDTVYTADTDSAFTRVFVRNDQDRDVFALQSGISTQSGDGALIGIDLIDTSGTVFDSIAFPESSFDLDDFDAFSLGGDLPTNFNFFGLEGFGDGFVELDSLEYSVVPLPAAAWLFLSGLAGLGALRRTRR